MTDEKFEKWFAEFSETMGLHESIKPAMRTCWFNAEGKTVQIYTTKVCDYYQCPECRSGGIIKNHDLYCWHCGIKFEWIKEEEK